VRFGGTYYDPSYGQTYTDFKDMQAKAIAAFYNPNGRVDEPEVRLDLNGNGNQTDRKVSVFLIRKSVAGKEELKEDPRHLFRDY
jgi:hypothetical protein